MKQLKLSLLGDCRVVVGETSLTPTAPLAFATVLLLALRPAPITRADLSELLFGYSHTPHGDARHCIRQLLYRIRSAGLVVREVGGGLLLESPPDPLESLLLMDRVARAVLPARSIAVLPSYEPALGRPFGDWVEGVRARLSGEIRTLLLNDLRQLFADHQWHFAQQLAHTLSTLDPHSEEITSVRAESLLMLSRKSEAISIVDRYLEDADAAHAGHAAMRQMRTRLVRAPAPQRECSMVGRAEALTFLGNEWHLAQSTGPRLTLVRGAAGIGKTRLAEEFSLHISVHGGHSLAYRCDDISRQQPLSLFSHLLADLRSMRGSLGADPRYRSLLDRLTDGTVRSDGSEADVPAEALRFDIQCALIDLVDAVAVEKPLLLIIDDVHFLDAASQSVVRALATSSTHCRVHVLACARPSLDGLQLSAPSPHVAAIDLSPLTDADSSAILLELCPALGSDKERLTACLLQAAGNPLYLQLVSRRVETSSDKQALDIRALASAAYSSLNHVARAVLETTLLLGRFATLPRVLMVAECSEADLLTALRQMEEYDLIHYAGGVLVGPHALLTDALAGLIPSAVSAALSHRIAAVLELECDTGAFQSPLALASAQHWLAGGDPPASVRLLKRCADHAASIGEPAAAVALLQQVELERLPPDTQALLLDEIARHAGAGGQRQLAADTVRQRLAVAKVTGEDDKRVRALELRLIEADLLNGASLASAVAPLLTLLRDASSDAPLRAQAAVKLMVIADIEFDGGLAETVHGMLESVYQHAPHLNTTALDTNALRAAIVYHTTFGDVSTALSLAQHILDTFPNPTVNETIAHGRNFAAYSLYRLRETQRAASIVEENYHFMLAQGALGEALYSASLRSEIAITDGDFDAAMVWLERCQDAARNVPPHQLSPNAGFDANAGVLAMLRGAYSDAESFFLAPQRKYKLLSAARYRAISLAMLARLWHRSGGCTLSPADFKELHSLYQRGRKCGSQDSVVEALWCALMLEHKSDEASELLRDYLTNHRRERSRAEWFLRHTTAADPVWQDFPAL